MTKSKKVGKSAIKSVLQNQRQIILPIDDARNNPIFRKSHPYVIFKGTSPPPVTTYSQTSAVAKSDVTTRLNIIPDSLTSTAHLNPTRVVEDSDSYVDQVFEGNYDNPSDQSDETSFLFHEVAQESYDLDFDTSVGGGVNPAILSSEGVAVVTSDTFMPSPTNLSVSEFTLNAETSSTDGNPTYIATLAFESMGLEDGYEIRLIKQ